MMKKKTYQNPTMDIVKVGWKGHLLAGTIDEATRKNVDSGGHEDWE